MEQPQYNMFHRNRVEQGLLSHYTKYGLGTTIWSPLASGLLTGKYNNGIPDGSRASMNNMSWLRNGFTQEKMAKVRQLTEISNDLGCTMAQLALAWSTKFEYVSTVITGASRASQVHENMKALDIIPLLDSEIMARIDTILS